MVAEGFQERLDRMGAVVAKLCKQREDLYNLNAARLLELKQEAERTTEDLEDLSWESTASIPERAQANFIRGRVFDFGSEYDPRAEQCLTKAVKLNPALIDAWNCLGQCLWKKKDMQCALHCFNYALQKLKNVESLQQLSILKRTMAKAKGAEDPKSLVEESIVHAKEAVTMEIKNCSSWYVLGNAYMNLYFTTGAADLAQLQSAIKAYSNAERDGATSRNPDLHFNRAMVQRYLEEHRAALEGFALAGRIDPSLPCQPQIDTIVAKLSRLHASINAKGFLKPKKLEAIAGSVVTECPLHVPAGHTVRGVKDLAPGPNANLALPCRLIQDISDNNAVPLSYVAVDHQGSCFALSVFSTAQEAIRMNNSITILNPVYKPVHCLWRQKEYTYPSVRVENAKQLLVGGKETVSYQSAAMLASTNIT